VFQLLILICAAVTSRVLLWLLEFDAELKFNQGVVSLSLFVACVFPSFHAYHLAEHC
jgi:hypothetical protein